MDIFEYMEKIRVIKHNTGRFFVQTCTSVISRPSDENKSRKIHNKI